MPIPERPRPLSPSPTGAACGHWGADIHRLALVLLVLSSMAGWAVPGHAEIFVANGNDVLVFADDAHGNVAPTRRLMTTAGNLAIDPINQEIFVEGAFGIEVYPLDFDDASQPIRFITTDGLHPGPRLITELMVDPVHDELYVMIEKLPPVQPAPSAFTLYVLARDADGWTLPVRTLDPAQFSFFSGMFLDLARDELYLIGDGGVHVYPRTIEGVAPPTVRTIENPSLRTADALFLDRAKGELYVTIGSTRVAVFNAFSDGPTSPSREIVGPDTEIEWPAGLVVNDRGEIIVTNRALSVGDALITVFAPGTDGNAAPIRTIRGPSTLLSFAGGVTTDRALHGGAGFAAPVQPWIFVDGFASGDATSWSMTSP